MKKWQIAGLVIAIVLIAGIVIAEQMMFSTYYPAPAGKYREFSTTGKTLLATDEFGSEGANAKVGIGTTNPQSLLHTVASDEPNIAQIDTYDDGARFSRIKLRKSDTDTKGIPSQTDDGDYLGGIDFFGVDNTNNFEAGAQIMAVQDGMAEATVPTNLVFMTYGSTAGNFNQLVLHNDGNVGIGTMTPTTDAAHAVGGNLDVNDVWVRAADGGAGAWASAGGGGFDPDPMTGANDSSGEITFPNGFQMKWGKLSYSGDRNYFQTIAFSPAFPNACFQVMAVGGDSAASFADAVKIKSITRSNFQIYIRGNMEPAHWFAIGR